MKVDDLIKSIIDKEGRRYENVPGDRGGPTKFGITLGRLRTERGRHMTADDVRNLTEPEAYEIYRDAYFRRPKIDQLPEPLQAFAMDFYTTSGTNAISYLQWVLRDIGYDIAVDGELGEETLAAVEQAYAAMGDDLLRAYIVERTHFFGRIAANDAVQNKFLRGWINQRAKNFWNEVT